MNKKIIFLLLLIFLCKNSFSQHKHNSQNKTKSNAVLIPGLGDHSFKVTTDDEEAQKFFDQGLILIYGFNHNEAIRSFHKATELDPDLAMAYWGIAFSLGPNYNLPADNEMRKQAYDAMKTAIELSDDASQKEKDYIKALSKRYVKDVEKYDQQLPNMEFTKAMKDLSAKYPDDLDAATLYAESLMNLKPWQLWKKDGTPAEGTEEILKVLESVLKRNPNHPGANHYYIHAVEASNDPGRALASAKVLEKLVPAAGHLVHMPAHILFRVGDYEGASIANINAIKSDEEYLKKHKPEGIYPIMYYNHNLNFLSVSRMMEGKFNEAMSNANQIAVNIKPILPGMQMLENFYANPAMVLLSFGKWDEIKKFPDPDAAFKLYSSLIHFSKGVAYAATGEIDAAKNQYNLFKDYKSKTPAEHYMGYTTAGHIQDLANEILEARIAFAEGDKLKAIDLLKSAVIKEDSVNYNEPPDWYPSVRLTLGSFLYQNENYPEAEMVFRDDLKKYPHNGRGLFGLMESLKAQNKNDEAKVVEAEFNEAWKNAEVKLSMSDF